MDVVVNAIRAFCPGLTTILAHVNAARFNPRDESLWRRWMNKYTILLEILLAVAMVSTVQIFTHLKKYYITKTICVKDR